MKNEDTTLVLSKLLDGERVVPSELAEALATREGVHTLVDFVSLRQAVTVETVTEPDAPERPSTRWRPMLRLVPRVAAAVLVFAIGVASAPWLRPGREAGVRPPARLAVDAPAEVIKVVPAGARFGEPAPDAKEDKLWS